MSVTIQLSEQIFFKTISATENFTFKIGNSRVVENIFPEKN